MPDEPTRARAARAGWLWLGALGTLSISVVLQAYNNHSGVPFETNADPALATAGSIFGIAAFILVWLALAGSLAAVRHAADAPDDHASPQVHGRGWLERLLSTIRKSGL